VFVRSDGPCFRGKKGHIKQLRYAEGKVILTDETFPYEHLAQMTSIGRLDVEGFFEQFLGYKTLVEQEMGESGFRRILLQSPGHFSIVRNIPGHGNENVYPRLIPHGYGILARMVFKMRLIQGLLMFCELAVCVCFPFSASRACTIFAATGDMVKNRGSIIAKNRDNLSYLYTALKFVRPENGLAFVGIFDVRADGYVTAGINEKGLTIVNASAVTVPIKKRHVATEDLTERLLTSFDSVRAVLFQRDLFQKSHPALYIMGDATQIASVEVAPQGKVAFVVRENRGRLALTNHYTHRELRDANERLSKGSVLRLRRVNYLMKSHGAPFTIDDFIAFSNDTNAGRQGALWREAHGYETTRTLAGWVVYVPTEGFPELYVKLVNSGESSSLKRMTLDGSFWEEGKAGDFSTSSY